jgi:hypothetical protein
MKRFPLYAALFAASLAFASCSGDANDGDATNDDTAILTDGDDMNSMNSGGRDTNTIIMQNGTSGTNGTTNADGSVTYPDGVIRGTDGSMRRANGTVMTDVEIREYETARGKTLTTDGTVRDRDGDGRVGTAEVKEEYKQGRDAVKGEYKDVKKDIKD